MLLALGQPFLTRGHCSYMKASTSLARVTRDTAFLTLLDHSHTKLPPATRFTSGCLELAHNLGEFKQRVHASRSCTYHTLHFNPVPQALFSVRAACTPCELTPAFPAFRPSTCTPPAVVHVASHNEGTANSISLTSPWHWPYLYCMSIARSGKRG